MEKYVPKIYAPSIDKVPYDLLKRKGITHLLFDLDNTLVPPHSKKVSTKVKELFKGLKEKGFTVIIFSNSPHKRLRPFGTDLEVDFNAFSMKPFQRSFRKILKKYNIEKNAVAIIGDQILTDILGGNRCGITTILITPLSTNDMILTKWNRFRENRIIQKLEKRNLFMKEKYYDEKM